MEYVNQVQPQTVVKLLEEEGISITLQQAKGILELMYMLADIALDILEEECKTSP